MRIGNWLGGSVIMALATIHGMAATARTAEHVTTVPIGGSLDGQSGDRYYGVYVPTRFGGVAPDQNDVGEHRRAQKTERHAAGQRPGHRLRSARVVHLQS